MSVCRNCVSGWLRPGTPSGRESRIHGFDVYLAEPPEGTPTEAIIVFITDGFGWQFANNRLLADDYAESGYRVYVPEFMNGWACPTWALDINPLLIKTDGGLLNWIKKPYYIACLIYCGIGLAFFNALSRSYPRVTSFLNSLRMSPSAEEKDLPVFATGYCWGGKHAVLLTHASATTSDGKPFIDASFTAHPTGLSIPEDIEKAVKPLSIAVGTEDFLCKVPKYEEAKTVLEKRDMGEVVFYEGGKHGFAVRDEPYYGKSDEQSVSEDVERQSELAERAERQAIAWFDKQLTARESRGVGSQL